MTRTLARELCGYLIPSGFERWLGELVNKRDVARLWSTEEDVVQLCLVALPRATASDSAAIQECAWNMQRFAEGLESFIGSAPAVITLHH